MKHVGILGGTRFIGYHLTCALASAGYRVTLFNRGRTTPPRPLPSGVRVTTGDRNRPVDLATFLSDDYDAVFDISGLTAAHVAAIVDAPRRGSIGHYVFCSTSSVYRRPMRVPCPESAETISERGTYGGDKRLAERFLIDAARTKDLPVTIVRPCGVVGPYDAAQAQPVFARIRHSLTVPIRPGQRGRMTFLFVADFASACLRVLQSRAARGAIYNLAGPEAVDPREFIRLCAAAAGVAARACDVQHWPYTRLDLAFSWPDEDIVLDTTAARHDLGMEFTPLERALGATWMWLQDDEWRLRPDLARGERYIREDGRLPSWIKPWLRLRNLVRP